MWQKDDRIRKSPLKFCVYYYSILSGDCQASIITELWQLSVVFCVTLWHIRIFVWFCTRSEWACSPIGRPPTSPIHSVRYWIGYSRLGMLLDMVISGSSLTFLPSKRCIAAWILSSKNCSITGYVIINAFCHNNTKTGTRQFFKNFFF